MNIAQVIGWKFNEQPGMVCKEVNGILRIVEFPGGVPSQAAQNTWTAEYAAFVAAGGLVDQRAARDLDSSNVARLLFEVNFDQENRVRTLEGRAAVTRLQYRAALIATLKTL